MPTTLFHAVFSYFVQISSILNALMDIVVSGNPDLDTLLQNEQVKENVEISAYILQYAKNKDFQHELTL